MKKIIFWFVIVIALSACGNVLDPGGAAQYYSALATGTSQAQIVPMTQTAGAMEMVQTQGAATTTAGVQTQQAQVTQTAMSWTPTPVPSATANIPATLAWNDAQNKMIEDRQRVEREALSNTFEALFWWVAGIVVLFLIVAVAYPLIKRLFYIPQPIHESGKPHPMIEVVEGISWDIDRAANGMVQASKKFLPQLPVITAERQDHVTFLAQRADMMTRIPKLSWHMLKQLEAPEQNQLALPEPVKPLDTSFLLPSWDLMQAWDSKDGIPYYTARGMEIIDEKQYAHLAAIGATGAGKSRRFFRPVITCALAQGHRVVIIGKSADYWPFEGHPNSTLLKVSKITEPGQAEKYAKILEAIIQEMNRRDDVLTAAHKSTWSELGLSQTFIVLDELGNALRLMDRSTSNQCRIWIEGLMSESRKVGFRMMIANQRATGMASILSQAGKAVFRVELDEERHHGSLTGASALADGYYIARLGVRQEIAGAFEPTDEEIQKFLASRPVDKIADEDEWIDGIATDAPESLPTETPKPALQQKPRTVEEFIKSLSEKEYEILQMHIDGNSQAKIEKAIFGKIGGDAYYRVKDVITRYKAVNASSSAANMPNLATSAA